MEDEFSLSDLLEIDFRVYLKSKGKTEANYDFVGVRVEGIFPRNLTDVFSREIPLDAEVVVNYRPIFYEEESSDGKRTIANAYGTALVPKKHTSPMLEGYMR